MLYREIFAVCSQIHTKHINILCGQNVELLNIKPLGSEGLNLVSTTWSVGKSVPTSTSATWPVMYCQGTPAALPICGSQRPCALVGERARNERLQPMDFAAHSFRIVLHAMNIKRFKIWKNEGVGKMCGWKSSGDILKCILSIPATSDIWKFQPVTNGGTRATVRRIMYCFV